MATQLSAFNRCPHTMTTGERLLARLAAAQPGMAAALRLALVATTTLLLGACSAVVSRPTFVASPIASTLPVEQKTQLAAASGQALDQTLRSNYCAELFLANGIDVLEAGVVYEAQSPYERPDDPLILGAYRKCLARAGASGQAAPTVAFPTEGVALSLSGGGTRSGSFSIGVLKALHELGVLDDVDSISSVSGGGYAAYWYYMQRYYQFSESKAIPLKQRLGLYFAKNKGSQYDRLGWWDKLTVPLRAPAGQYRAAGWLAEEAGSGLEVACREVAATSLNHSMGEVFRTHSEKTIDQQALFQEHLAQASDLINYSGSPAVEKVESGALLTTHFLTVPIYWVTDGFLNLGVFNGSVLTDAYRKGIERAYGLSPDVTFDPYAEGRAHSTDEFHNGLNGSYLFWRRNARAELLDFHDLRTFVAFTNACAARGVAPFRRVPNPIINASVSTGGSREDRTLAKRVFSFTPLMYGSDYVTFDSRWSLWKDIPVSKAYAISGAALDSGAREFDWMAGGLLSTLNLNIGYKARNPATNDGFRGPLAYWSGKAIPFGLDQTLPLRWRPTIRLSDGGHSENLGLYSLIKRVPRRIIVVDAEQDGRYGFDAYNRLRSALQREQKLSINCVRDDGAETACPHAYEFHADAKGRDPVIHMRVSGYFNPDGSPRDIDILYIKLSAIGMPADATECMPSTGDLRRASEASDHADASVKYPCSVTQFYVRDKRESSEHFPHNSTADIWYRGDQFEAYRDLGYYIGMTSLKRKLATLSGWSAADRCRYRASQDAYFRSLFSGAMASPRDRALETDLRRFLVSRAGRSESEDAEACLADKKAVAGEG